MHRYLVIASFVSILALRAPAAHAAADGSFDRTLTVNGMVDLSIRTGSGNISIRAGQGTTMRVVGRIHAEDGWFSSDAQEKVRSIEANPPIEQSGNTIRIGRPEDSSFWSLLSSGSGNKVTISYEILTPAETRLHAATGSGNHTIDGLRGAVEATAGSGAMTISNIGDEVTARTGSGNISVSQVRGSLRARTGSGDIHARAIAGGLDSRTGSGNVEASLTAPGDVDVMTGSGDVLVAGVRGSLRAHTGSGDVAASGEPGGPWNVVAGSGDITLVLSSQVAFDLQAQSGSGRITVDHPLVTQGAFDRHRIEGKVGSGGPLLALKSGSGRIQIR